MSDHSRQPYVEGDVRAGQSMQCYQSVWMAHWTQTSSTAAPHVRNGSSLSLLSKDDFDAKKSHLISGLQIASNVSTSSKRFTEVTEARTIRIMNDGEPRSSENLISERLDCQLFPMVNVHQSGAWGLNNELDTSSHRQVTRPYFDCEIKNNARTTVSHFQSVLAMAARGTGPSSREHLFQSERVSQYLGEPANPLEVVRDAFAGSHEDHCNLSTQMVPYRSSKGKAAALPFTSRHEKLKQLNLASASKEYLSTPNSMDLKGELDTGFGNFKFLGSEKKPDDHSTSGKFGISFERNSNASLSLHDPSTGNNQSYIGETRRKMQDFSGAGFFPNQSTSLKKLKSVNSSHGSYTLQRMPGHIHDMGTTRNCTVGGLAGGPVTFSQTTQSLLFAKKTDANNSRENQEFEESRDSLKLNRNMFSRLLSLSPPLGLDQKGVTIQLLDSSSDRTVKDDIRDITPEVCPKNESSAETDTMDMEACKERNDLSGVNSSPSNKNFFDVHDPPSQNTIACAEKDVKHREAMTRLPDMNEIPVLPAPVSSTDNAEPSTSRTQSLDAELLISHTEDPADRKASRTPNGPLTQEPSSRWLKRFRLSVSDTFGIGTKSSNLGKVLSHEKVNKIFSKIIGGSKSYSSDNKGERAADHSAIVLHKVESSPVDPAKNDLDILLSHSWIQRWRHKRTVTQKKNLEALVVCEPRSTKFEFDELRNKQFPSIRALALMGRAMNGVQPCEFRKKGSFVVWNTKGSLYRDHE